MSSVTAPSQNVVQPAGFPAIQVDLDDIKCGRETYHVASRVGLADGSGAKGVFVKNFSEVIPVARDARYKLTDVSINMVRDRPIKKEFITAFFSTVIPFVPLVKSFRETYCIVSYAIRDESGVIVLSSSVSEKVSGYYRGWSIARLASVSRLQDDSMSLLFRRAGRMVASDIVAKVASGHISMSGFRNRDGVLRDLGMGGRTRGDASMKVSVASESSRGSDSGKVDDIVGQLKRLREARDSGLLTQEQFEAKRKSVIEKE